MPALDNERGSAGAKGSRSGSRAGSRAGSRTGSRASVTRKEDLGGSRPASRASSSRGAGSRAGSGRPDSKVRRESKPNSRASSRAETAQKSTTDSNKDQTSQEKSMSTTDDETKKEAGAEDAENSEGIRDQETDNRDGTAEAKDEDGIGSAGRKSRSSLPVIKKIEPEDFDSRSFLESLAEIKECLQSEEYQKIDSNYPADELNAMVSAVTMVMENFKHYSLFTQKQMESLRDDMRDIYNKMHKRIQSRPPAGDENLNFEEKELQAKIQNLNKDLGKASEDLARASSVSAETEQEALKATLAAEKAKEDAQKIQEEYEARREAEEEAKRIEEEKRAEEEKKREEEERRLEEERQAEEARKARLRKEDTDKAPEWENWPTFTYRVDAGEFDQGVGCLIRADETQFQESTVKCEKIEQLKSTFTLGESEELVSNIIQLLPSSGDEQQPQVPMYICLPHVTSRASAISREPVIKAYIDMKWVELPSQEVTIDAYKDMKFVQAEVKAFTTHAVVIRYKNDFLEFSKRGGCITSNVDPRVNFRTERGTFKHTEHFTIQLQPVDSATQQELRLKPEGKGLLTASAIVSMEWSSRHFENTVWMTLPCPPNPVKARKAAAIRAAKEAKMNNPAPRVPPSDEPAKKKDDNQRNKQQANKWYMGQYSLNDDDESEELYMIWKRPNGKWAVEQSPDCRVNAVRLDQVEVPLKQPLEKFVVLRVRPNVEPKEAEAMAGLIEAQLTNRMASVILKQKSDDPCDIVVHVCPSTQQDRVIKRLEEEGYEEGPGASANVSLQEGDVLELGYRGNIKAEDVEASAAMVYNSHITTKVNAYVEEVDKFLQKNYNVYRGFVQINKKIKVTPPPSKKEDSEEKKEVKEEFKYQLVCDHLVSIPKELPTEPQPVVKAPIIIKNMNDPINEEVLREIALEMGNEWRQVAKLLNVRRVRIQAILRNNATQEHADDENKYDMLLTWAKKVPRGVSKLSILSHALGDCGRQDLAEKLQEMNITFQKNKQEQVQAN